MKKRLTACFLSAILIIAILVGCASMGGQAPVTVMQVEVQPLLRPIAGDSAAQAVAIGANDFAFRLSAMLAEDLGDDNLVVSPYSVWLPLAALLNATETAKQDALLGALGAGGISVEDVNRAASRMLFDLTNSGNARRENQLRIANAMFVAQERTLRHDFAQRFADYFRGTVMRVDFRSQEAVDAVNQWAYDNTDGLIRDIIQEFKPETIAAIANAIYFSDRWRSEFRAADTRQDTFHAPRGAGDAYFMHREGLMSYFEDDTLQAVRLPFIYGGGLYILLPRTDSAAALLSDMTAEYFAYIHSNSYETPGKLLLPRFSIESELPDLPRTLIALGVPLFDGGIVGLIYEDQDLWLGDAVQKAVIEVDERGTTAAAVTVMEISEEGPPPSPFPPFEMICDRPFVFVLYQTTVDGGAQVLFTGVVNQP